MANVGDLVVRVLGDNAQFDSAINKSKTKFENFAKSAKNIGDSLSKAGRKLTTFVTLPILGLGAAFVKAAADAEETNSKFNVVFRDQADAVREWAKEFAGATGRSTIENIKFLASVQDLFVPLGVTRDKAADLSKSVVTLATDMSSFNNLPTADVIRDIQSALVGNHETVRKYGVVLDEATVNQELLNMGIVGGNKAATAAEKALARLNLIMAGTTDAQGDAIRTADSFTNRFRALKSSIIDLSESFGNLLLPTIQKLVEGITKAVKFVDALDEDQKKLIITVAALAAAIGPLLIVVGKMIALFAAMSGPVGWITLAVVAVVALSIAIWGLNKASREEKKLEKEVIALKDQLTNARGKERIAILETTLAKQKERLETLEGIKTEVERQIRIRANISGIAVAQKEFGAELEKVNEKLKEASFEYAILALQIKSAHEQQRIEIGQREILLPIIEEEKEGRKELTDTTDDLTESLGRYSEKLGLLSEQEIDYTNISLAMYAARKQAAEDEANAIAAAAEEITRIRNTLADAIVSTTLGITSALSQIWGNYFATLLADESLTEKERKRIRHDAAVTSRNLALFQAIVAGAQAVVNAFATPPFLPLGLAMGALATVLTGFQIAAIASTPIPALAEGGIIREPTILLAGERGPEKITPLGDEQPIIIGISIDGRALDATITKNVRNRRILIDKGSLT